MSSMQWWPVALWDLKRVLRRADFIISVLLAPVLAIGTGIFATSMKQRSERKQYRIAVVSETPGRKLAALPNVTWVESASSDSVALKREVQMGDLDGALIIPPDYAAGGRIEFIMKRESSRLRQRIEDHVRAQARQTRAAQEGLDSTQLARLDAPVTLVTQLADPAARASRTNRIVALTISMLLIMVIFVTGSYIMVGISGEKQARFTEVVLSAINAQAWIDGKIVAYTVIGLLQALLWGISGVVLLILFSMTFPPAISLGSISFYLLFAVLGFVLYVAFFATIMATLKDIHSASKLQGNLFFLPFIPFFFMDPVMENPDASWAVAVSMFPLFSPMLMPLRMALSATPAWQVALALLLLVGAAWLMRLAAGHAFRIGMLMYGKDVTLPELVRMAKRS